MRSLALPVCALMIGMVPTALPLGVAVAQQQIQTPAPPTSPPAPPPPRSCQPPPQPPTT